MVARPKPKAKARLPEFREATQEEGWAMLDERARHYLGMGAEDFLHAWDAGEIENPDRPEVMRVIMLLPFVR